MTVQLPVKKETVGIMLCLDAILDTRHGTIKKSYPELFSRLRHSAKYYLRRSDQWGRIDPELDEGLLTLRYQGRDIETIRHSQLTMVVRLVIDLIGEILTRIKDNDPHVAAFYFIINTHPYNLTVELITEIARKFLIQIGYPNAPIGFINKPWKEITPQFLKEENILYWYCYHYENWLRENFEPIAGKEPSSSDLIVGAPDTKMFAPMICQDPEAMDQFVDELEEKMYVDQFSLTKAIFRNIIEFEFLPVATFSTIDVKRFAQLERTIDMERSEILSAGQAASKVIMLRLGEPTQANAKLVNTHLDEIERLIYELRVNHTKGGMNFFRTRLAMLHMSLLKLYNNTPFSMGEDIEDLFDQLSLTVDTSEEEYRQTEAYWNEKGVKTIKRLTTLDNGEEIYRCICAEDIHVDLHGMIYANTILPQQPAKQIRVKPVDFVALENYFV